MRSVSNFCFLSYLKSEGFSNNNLINFAYLIISDHHKLTNVKSLASGSCNSFSHSRMEYSFSASSSTTSMKNRNNHHNISLFDVRFKCFIFRSYCLEGHLPRIYFNFELTSRRTSLRHSSKNESLMR